ncbi:MAG TPA: LysM peptidoglycan-binding domain-containing protein [Virgibacillus sp.]|nr:LysM peptidoglycan-binding domain-containing protein [Virgibacillus sp.]
MKKLSVSLAFTLALLYAGISTASAESYEVQEGDSLWEIADQFDTTVDNLIDINDLNSNVIQPNQELTVNNSYTVEKGDTLSGIAKQFDATVSNLKEWNKLDTDVLQIGQELKINQVEASETDKKEEKSTEQATEKAEEQTENTEEQTENKEEQATESEEPKAEAETETEDNEAAAESDDGQAPQGETVDVTATAYTAECDGCSGVTTTGVDLNENPDAKVIAVDPSVIPLGSEVYVEGYGYATAADTGGAIQGNKIDLHVPSKEEANNFGVQNVKVTIVE